MSDRLSRRGFVAGALATAGAVGIAMNSSASASGEFTLPDSPFGRQLAWALSILTGSPTGLTNADVSGHFAPSLIAQVPAASLVASLDQASVALGPLKPVKFAETPNETSGVLEVQTKTGDLMGLVLVVSAAPESLITILTFKSIGANATPAASPVASPEIPDSPAAARLTWFLGILTGLPVTLTVGDLPNYFEPGFIKSVGAGTFIDKTNQLSIGSGPFTLESFVKPPTDVEAKAIIAGKNDIRYLVTITVSAAPDHLIAGLLLDAAPVTDAFKSWDEFAADWSSRAEYSSFVVVEVGKGAGGLIAGLNETAVFAIGSAFKYFVLGSLAIAIEAGVLSWDDKLAIRDDWKSLPSGDFQNEPVGKEFTLRQFAEKMISISDNTAADHLLHRLGRENVETAMAQMGIANPAENLPFLTTRELFALKIAADDATLKAFLSARGYGRLVMLATLDAIPLDVSMATSWTTPRYIEQIEWFASVNDLANINAWLFAKAENPVLTPLLDILSLNPGVTLNAKTWPYAAFKGGSEPGVLTLTWYLTSASGRNFVVSAALNDTVKALDAASAITSANRAINLLANGL